MTLARPIVRLARVLAAVLVIGMGAGEAYGQATPGARPAAVRRMTLVVNDMEKSLDFYLRIGLTKSSERTATDNSTVFGAAELPLTADSTHSHIVVLNGSDDQGLALLWYDHPALPSARGNLLGIGTGDVIVGIVVPDIESAYSRLNQIGVRFPAPPGRFTAADGTSQSGRHMYAYDPDGRMIEIIQLDSRK